MRCASTACNPRASSERRDRTLAWRATASARSDLQWGSPCSFAAYVEPQKSCRACCARTSCLRHPGAFGRSGSTMHIATIRAMPTTSGSELCCSSPFATRLIPYRRYVFDSSSDRSNLRTRVSSSFLSKTCTTCASEKGSASRWRLTTNDESNTTADVHGNAYAMCSASPPPSEWPVVTIVSLRPLASLRARRRYSATARRAPSY